MEKKPCMGLQKIPIAKIPKKNHLQVTFSKRRAGVFKKASELSTLCGVEIALIVFSPANKAFSFGHPNVDSIIDRFLGRNPPPDSGTNGLVEAHRNANIRELNMQLTQVLQQLEVEKKHGEMLSDIRKARQSKCWWEAPINELGLHELEQLKTAMEELKKNVEKKTDKVVIESEIPSPIFWVNNSGVENVNRFQSKPLEIPAANPNVLPFYYLGYGRCQELL